ncbi:MAG TPA: DUF6734 family protein [Acetobacteraceae bacterium]|nr:DUF6734 family protein [Acetobacteraceae bacterium]
MRAVWSFWSVPFARHYRHAWARPVDHLLAWVISVGSAQRHYRDTLLVTDTPGRRLLVDRLGLAFADVSTELDRLRDHDPGWWMLGKLVAYGLQDAPFVHVDNDVFLWKRLPPRLEAAAVLAQNPERHVGGDYRPAEVMAAMRATGGVVPPEWEWGCSLGGDIPAENCGILGGTATGFLQHFARTAIAFVDRPENAAGWARLGGAAGHNHVVEQFLLAACLGHHRSHPASPWRGVRAQYLFPSWREAFDSNEAARVGYTHLMGGKRHPTLGQRLTERVRRDWPDLLRRCERCAALAPAL